MEIKIRNNNLPISHFLTKHIEDNLKVALDRFSSSIKSINVSLKDQNGPKGGNDKTCLVKVSLRQKGEVFITSSSNNLYSLVYKLTERLKYLISRKLKRNRNSRRLVLNELT